MILNLGGRILDRPGQYVAGWIKRGPNGVIGTNKLCAAETAAALIDDAVSGALRRHVRDRGLELSATAAAGGQAVVDYAGWQRIDAVERARGARYGRPRVKLTDRAELVRAAEPLYRSPGNTDTSPIPVPR